MVNVWCGLLLCMDLANCVGGSGLVSHKGSKQKKKFPEVHIDLDNVY